MHYRLVIELDAELHDDTWTAEDLVGNAVDFLQAAIDREQRENDERFPHPPYTVDTCDLTVWVQGDYLRDLAENGTTV